MFFLKWSASIFSVSCCVLCQYLPLVFQDHLSHKVLKKLVVCLSPFNSLRWIHLWFHQFSSNEPFLSIVKMAAGKKTSATKMGFSSFFYFVLHPLCSIFFFPHLCQLKEFFSPLLSCSWMSFFFWAHLINQNEHWLYRWVRKYPNHNS